MNNIKKQQNDTYYLCYLFDTVYFGMVYGGQSELEWQRHE